jgi:transposase
MFTKGYSRRDIQGYLKENNPLNYSPRKKNNTLKMYNSIVNYIKTTYFVNDEKENKSGNKISRLELSKSAFSTKSDCVFEINKYMNQIYDLHPVFKWLSDMFHELSKILNGRDVTKLDVFINKYADCRFAEIRSFIKSIKSDKIEIKNGILTGISSGLAEGCNNKLKTLQRMTYGKLKNKNLELKFALTFKSIKNLYCNTLY